MRKSHTISTAIEIKKGSNRLENKDLVKKIEEDQIDNFKEGEKINKTFNKIYQIEIFEKFEKNRSITDYFQKFKENKKPLYDEIVRPFDSVRKIHNLIEDNKLNDLKKLTLISIIKNKFLDNYGKVETAIKNKKDISKTLKYLDITDELKELDIRNSSSKEISTEMTSILKSDINDELIQEVLLKSEGSSTFKSKEFLKLKEFEEKIDDSFKNIKNIEENYRKFVENQNKLASELKIFNKKIEEETLLLESLIKDETKLKDKISDLEKNKYEIKNKNNSDVDFLKNKKISQSKKISENRENLLKFCYEEREKLNKELIESKIHEKGIHYIFNIDVSGSMSGEPIKQVAKNFKNFIHKIKQTDNHLKKISVIKFNHQADYEIIDRDVENVSEIYSTCSGGTNYIPVLDKTHNLIKTKVNDKSNILIFFLTDGEPNENINKISDSIEKIKNDFPQKNILFFAVGYGSDFNRNVLESMVKKFNNNETFQKLNGETFHLIHSANNADELEKIFLMFENLSSQKLKLIQSQINILKNTENDAEENFKKSMKFMNEEMEDEEKFMEKFKKIYDTIIQENDLCINELGKQLEELDKKKKNINENINNNQKEKEKIENDMTLNTNLNKDINYKYDRNIEEYNQYKKNYEEYRDKISKNLDNELKYSEENYENYLTEMQKKGLNEIKDSEKETFKSHLTLYQENINFYKLKRKHFTFGLEQCHSIFTILFCKLKNMNESVKDFYVEYSAAEVSKRVYEIFIKYYFGISKDTPLIIALPEEILKESKDEDLDEELDESCEENESPFDSAGKKKKTKKPKNYIKSRKSIKTEISPKKKKNAENEGNILIEDLLFRLLQLKKDQRDIFDFIFKNITPKELIIKLHESGNVDEYISEISEQLKEEIKEIDSSLKKVKKDITTKIKEIKDSKKKKKKEKNKTGKNTNKPIKGKKDKKPSKEDQEYEASDENEQLEEEESEEDESDEELDDEDIIKNYLEKESRELEEIETIKNEKKKESLFILNKKGIIKKILMNLIEKKEEALNNTYDEYLGENFLKLLDDIDKNYFKHIKNLETAFECIQ